MTAMTDPRELIQRLVEIQDLYLRLDPEYVQYENDPGSLIELLMQVRQEAKEYLATPEPATDLVQELIGQCKPLDPELAAVLTPSVLWELYEDA